MNWNGEPPIENPEHAALTRENRKKEKKIKNKVHIAPNVGFDKNNKIKED